MANIVVCLGVFLLSLITRLVLIWPHRHRGCDAYYFLLSSEQFRKDRKIPIVLPPVYVLEEQEQWYPPGFSVLLSLLPKKFVEQYYWTISPLLDSLLAMLVYLLVYIASGDTIKGLTAGALAGAMYAFNGASLPDTTSLNSRPLGALLLTLTMLFLIYPMTGAGLAITISGFLMFGFLLLMSHKLSPQLLYFLLLVMLVASGSPHYAIALGLLLIVSIILSRGFILKVWRGQYDILSFWSRNWKLLGAHSIYGSPVYPALRYKDTRRLHIGGLRGLVKGSLYLGMNTFVLPLIFVFPQFSHLSQFDQRIILWVAGTYLLAVLTQLVPFLKFLGEGHRYLKLAAVPVCYLAVLPIAQQWSYQGVVEVLYYTSLVISFIIALLIVLRLFGFMSDRSGSTIPFLDTGLRRVTEYLKEADTTNVLCIPDSLGDAIGYYSRKRILRGTHNVPFKWVIPFFPVYQRPLEQLVKEYAVSHIVVYSVYVKYDELGIDSFADKVLEDGEYRVYRSRI